MSRLTFSCRAFVSGLLLAAITPAPAADLHIEEVMVTATRRTVSTAELAAAVSVVAVDELRDRKLITDALATIPGVFLQQTTPGQGAAIVRGQRGSAVLHLVDGMRLNNAIFRSAPSQYLALVPAAAVERIEVLRGTPASLYGSDAVGGAIQVVTHVPKMEGRETQVHGDVMAAIDSAESMRLLRGTVDVGNEWAVTSFSADLLNTGDRRVGGGSDVPQSGYESRAGRLAMSITPDKRRSWLFDVQYLEQPSTPRVDELVPGFGQTEPSSSEFFFEPNRRLFAHVKYALSDGPWNFDWRVDAAWQRIDDDRRTRDFQANERRIEANRSDLSGLMLVASRGNDLGSWLVGAEFYHDSVSSARNEVDITTGLSQTLTPRFPDGSSIDQAAVFWNADRTLTSRNTLSGGLRISSVDVELTQTSVSPAASIKITDGSGDIGWRFKIAGNWSVLANAGLGFRAPNIFDLGTLGNRPGNRFNIPNPSLESERVVQGDIGLRYLSDTFSLDIVAYALHYDDRIVSVLTGDVSSDGRDVVQSVNAAKSRVRGAELGLTADVSPHVVLRAVLNYTWGEQEIASLTEPGDRIPPLSGRAAIEWHYSDSLRFDSSLRFAGEQTRLSARDSNDIRINPAGTSGWGIVGVGANWRSRDGWSVALSADNLLDKRYRNHGSGIDAPGRNLAVSVRRVW